MSMRRAILRRLFAPALTLLAVIGLSGAAMATALSVEATRPPVDGVGVLDGRSVMTHRGADGLQIEAVSPLEAYSPGEPGALVEILSALRARDARRIAEEADSDIYSARALGELTRILADPGGSDEFALSALPIPGVFLEGAIRPPQERNVWFRWLSGSAWGGPPVLIVITMLAAFFLIYRLIPQLVRTRW